MSDRSPEEVRAHLLWATTATREQLDAYFDAKARDAHAKFTSGVSDG